MYELSMWRLGLLFGGGLTAAAEGRNFICLCISHQMRARCREAWTVVAGDLC